MDTPSSPSRAHVEPLALDAMDEVEDVINLSRQASGYVPTSMRIMAHKPDILRAFSALIGTIMRKPSDLAQEMKWLMAHSVSAAAGCQYCQAHTAANGAKAGLEVQKVAQLLTYETNPVFSDPERAVIDFGLAAGQVPNAVTRAHFDALRESFTEPQIVELVAVISLFGWLNRWNDTFASDLEDAPLAFAKEHLSDRGWTPGKHAPE
ncbi:MAG: peroxidase-related enzyme [Gammaproteobacteria bacterium]|nr:peroxidase-related enzyme [Gammaproteobacteria bacterium]